MLSVFRAFQRFSDSQRPLAGLSWAIATPAGFTGEIGHVYYLRLRTWDNACAEFTEA